MQTQALLFLLSAVFVAVAIAASSSIHKIRDSSSITGSRSYFLEQEPQHPALNVTWTVDQQNQLIQFDVCSQSSVGGWIGVGIASAPGSMRNAAITVVTVSPPAKSGEDELEAESKIENYYAEKNERPLGPLPETYAKLLSAKVSGQSTCVSFVRALLASPTARDNSIVDGLNYFIFAFSNSTTFGYHGRNRFAEAINPYDPEFKIPNMLAYAKYGTLVAKDPSMFRLNYYLQIVEKKIYIQILAKTLGWFAIGFKQAPTAGSMFGATMKNATYAVVTKGNVLQHYYCTKDGGKPDIGPLDFKGQSVVSSHYNEKEQMQSLTLVRNVDAVDEYDFAIKNESILVLWAFAADSSDVDFERYHARNRGTIKDVNFYN